MELMEDELCDGMRLVVEDCYLLVELVTAVCDGWIGGGVGLEILGIPLSHAFVLFLLPPTPTRSLSQRASWCQIML